MSRRRARRLLAPLAACFLALTLGAAAASAGAARADPAQLVLRLPDLPAGYGLLTRDCDRDPPLSGLAQPADRSCESYFARFWTTPASGPDPAVVISAALVFESAQRAAAVLEDPRRVASSLAIEMDREDFEVVEPAPAIGDEAVLLRATDGSAAVVWRSGPVLGALIAATGFRPRGEVDLQATIALATAQQARIATPTPLRPADNDSSQVALEDPSLDLPVWWLGRTLPRRGRLPALTMTSFPPGLFDDADRDFGPLLLYGQPGARSQVVLTLARPHLLRRPAMRRELRRMRRDPCSMVRHVTRPDGRATIFQRSPNCPKLDVRETPDALHDTTAVVVLHGVVVFAYADGCVSCHGPVSRYESIAGMRRIVKALRLREPNESTP